MSSRRHLALLSVTLALVVSACSGLRLSPVTAEPTSNWIPGKFIWHDLITHDISAVKLFYAGVFGWKFEALPGTDRYTVIRHNGEMIGGIAFSDRKIDGKPISQWVSMMSVPDVDRGVWLLDGLRPHVDRVEVDPLAVVLGLVRGPDDLHRLHPLAEHLVNLGRRPHAVTLQQHRVQPGSILPPEPIHILLGEVHPPRIQIVEVVVEESLAQCLVERKPGEVAVLQHDGHVATDFIEIRLLGTGRNPSECRSSSDRGG